MLNKFFAKPLEIIVGEQTLKFSSIGDFEFCMTGRIAVPSRKIIDMVKFTPDQLKKEARTIKDIEKRFVSILSNSIEDPNSINRALRELDPLIFSQDHSWRDVISGLNAGDDNFNPFRRIALVKYMQYLSARQEIIKYLYTEKKKMLKEPIKDEANGSSSFKDTLMLESTIFEPSSDGKHSGSEFERIPKGEPVTITYKPGDIMEIMLSKHKCQIISGDNMEFIDHEGRTYKLENGRTVIGRDTVSTILLDPSLRDISRLHLIIEKFDECTIQMTDLSSHGTYIPAKYMASHSLQ